ncbi:MAG TPA: hypothetical protein VF044_11330 [Actinomycetota bacterium]
MIDTMRIVIALFLAAHGLVHLLYLAPRPEDDPRYPFVPEERWSARAVGLDDAAAKAVAASLAILCAVVLVVAGVALLADAELWQPLAVLGSAVSLILLLGFMHPWLTIGVAIDVAIIAAVQWLHVPAALFDG